MRFPVSSSVRLAPTRAQVLLILLCITVVIAISSSLVQAFHLSFGHRLIKSAQNPQLNPASTLIRPIECRNAHNHSEAGICMFSIDCMQNKGVPLSVCKHNYFVGTCCRLPDYNNFVGIVYDLRDTEASQLLEARKGALLGQGTSRSEQSAPLMSTVALASPGPPAGSSPAAILYSSTSSASTQAAATTTSRHLSREEEEEEKLESRYIISSTSLFPSASTLQPTSGHQSSLAPAQMVGQQQVSESARNADGTTDQQHNSPQARPQNNKQQIVVPSETDSFHIQTALANQSAPSFSQQISSAAPVVELAGMSAPSGHQSQAYEVIKDISSMQDKSELMSSAHHQPPVAQQQFNIIEPSASQHIEQQQQHKRPAAQPQQSPTQSEKHTAPVHQEDSIYLVMENQPPNRSSLPSIVFSNNHHQLPQAATSQAASSSSKPAQPQYTSSSPVASSTTTTTTTTTTQPPSSPVVLGSTTSDQEFTLSSFSASQGSSSTATGSEGPTDSQVQRDNLSIVANAKNHSGGLAPKEDTNANTLLTTLALQTSSSPSSPAQTSSTGVNSQSPSTQHVDLVSSNTVQTTTPFTSSLSTALLPNISSHPYAPTEEPPQSISSLVPPNQSFSPSSSSSSAAGSTTPTKSTAGSSPSPPNQATTPQQGGSSVTLGQLYSNQHSGGPSPASTSGHHSPGDLYEQQHSAGNSHTSRPISSLMGLHAATKIVSSGSGANNLIPGLSGLQSAILSHIPFKIASGLSSGLSSYLQAAMKPTGNRPLLSSNTAPALQYQQSVANASANKLLTSTTPSLLSSSSFAASGGGIRFPTSSTTASTPAPEVVAAGSGGSFSIAGASSNETGAHNYPIRSSYDVVRDAQLVCGRPQVSPSSGSLGSEAKRRVARIVGGNQSSFGQWPWMVSLRQWRKGAFLHKCGAALLNENWAITAAHCVENVKASDLLLRLGEFDVSNQEEPYPYVERRVKTVVSHPSFDPKTFEYDLALLKFTEPIKYERNIVPVCVPSGNDSYVDRMATVIGWGRLYEDGPLPDVIQHVDVPIITNNECERMYKNAGYIEEIPEMFICAGISKGGRDSCEGDSGGPLTMVDHDGRSYLVGIISWGIGCALPSQPGVYTRITAFSGWINQITAFQ